MTAAAHAKGTAQASSVLPPWPPECERKEAHAPLVVGAEARSVLDRERDALDRQNDRADYCAGYYKQLAAERAK